MDSIKPENRNPRCLAPPSLPTHALLPLYGLFLLWANICIKKDRKKTRYNTRVFKSYHQTIVTMAKIMIAAVKMAEYIKNIGMEWPLWLACIK